MSRLQYDTKYTISKVNIWSERCLGLFLSFSMYTPLVFCFKVISHDLWVHRDCCAITYRHTLYTTGNTIKHPESSIYWTLPFKLVFPKAILLAACKLTYLFNVTMSPLLLLLRYGLYFSLLGTIPILTKRKNKSAW